MTAFISARFLVLMILACVHQIDQRLMASPTGPRCRLGWIEEPIQELRWNHELGPRMFSNVSLTHSVYNFNTGVDFSTGYRKRRDDVCTLRRFTDQELKIMRPKLMSILHQTLGTSSGLVEM